MNDHGPFDRILESATSRDSNARWILIGMGVVGVVLLLLVLPPISLLGGGDDGSLSTNGGSGDQTQGRGASGKAPKAPEGFEALSRVFNLEKPKGTEGPYALTVNLLQPVSDGQSLGLYTSRSGKWERLASARLVNNGTAVTGQVDDMPANIAVLRRTGSAVLVSGWLVGGATADRAALDVLTTVNPVDYSPAADGSLNGTATNLPSTRGNVMPTVRALTPAEVDSMNAILASPALRDAHVSALVQVALQPGNAGVDVDYQRVNPARKADFTVFVGLLADKLHQSNKSLSIALPPPIKAGVNWDTGAFDWEELARRADLIKLGYEPDPSAYYPRMQDILGFLKSKIDLRKVSLVVTRQSFEKGTDGLRPISLNEGLALASEIEVRTSSQITPNSSVIILGKNIFQDDGASGLRWDDGAYAVSFSYPGRGGQRTVWLENAFSLAFRLDLARRFGLGGVAIDDASLNPVAPSVWETLRGYAETGNVNLVQPNGVLLRPTWQIQAGSSEPGTKGNIVWKAPVQPGAYDVALVVSDGIVRAMQKIVLDVQIPGGTPGATTTGTPRAAGTPSTPATTQTAGPSGATSTSTPRPPTATATPRP